MVDPAIHETLLNFQIVLNLTSRIPQIYSNYRSRATGQLSFTTFFLAFGGAAARVATTFVNVPWEKGKGTLLLQSCIATVLNAIIISQILMYRHAPKPQAKKVD
jgi:mannose-P-dolichol utilization defect protein 1